MYKLLMATIAALALTVPMAQAQDKPQTRLQICAKEWRTVKPTMSIPKGEGRAVWNAWRTECIAKLPKPEKVKKVDKSA